MLRLHINNNVTGHLNVVTCNLRLLFHIQAVQTPFRGYLQDMLTLVSLFFQSVYRGRKKISASLFLYAIKFPVCFLAIQGLCCLKLLRCLNFTFPVWFGVMRSGQCVCVDAPNKFIWLKVGMGIVFFKILTLVWTEMVTWLSTTSPKSFSRQSGNLTHQTCIVLLSLIACWEYITKAFFFTVESKANGRCCIEILKLLRRGFWDILVVVYQ